MLQVAMACVDSVPERRPKMVEVVHMLEDIHQVMDTKDEPSRHSESEDRSNKSPQSVRDSPSDTPSSVMQTPSAYTPSDWFQNRNKEGQHPHPTPSHGQIVGELLKSGKELKTLKCQNWHNWELHMSSEDVSLHWEAWTFQSDGCTGFDPETKSFSSTCHLFSLFILAIWVMPCVYYTKYWFLSWLKMWTSYLVHVE